MKDDLKNLLEKNLVMTEEVLETVKKVRRYIVMTQIMGVIKFIIILAPIVFAIIYLPPLLQDMFSQYKEIIGGGMNLNQIDVNSLNELL